MKKLILLTSLFISTNSMADELHHYNEIKTAVMTGKTIHITLDFAQCSSLNKKVSLATSVGVFTPETFAITDHIATSLTHFTLNNPSFPGKAAYEFIRYTITDDDNVNLTYQVLDAINFAPITGQSSFNCKLETAAKIYA